MISDFEMRIWDCKSGTERQHGLRWDFADRAKVTSQRPSNQFSSHFGIDSKSALRNLHSAIVTAALLLALCPSVQAQQQKKVYRIGYFSGRSGAGPLDDVFKSALRELGYVEGQNISITYRWAEEKLDRLPALAVELVKLDVDIIVTETTPAALAAKKATTSIPIVMALSGDPVGAGVVTSLARPGANITGLTFIGTDVGSKLVELLKGCRLESPAWRIWRIQSYPLRCSSLKQCNLRRKGWA